MAFDFSYPNLSASARGWGSGYPNCHEENWVPLVAPNGVPFGRVHKRIVTLLELLLGESIRLGYAPKQGQCWGAVCRCSHRADGSCAEDSAGNPIPSNHSWGLAIDFNSLDNPYGSPVHKMPDAVIALFRKYGFRNLGASINDWQHFDFAGTPTDADAMTAKAVADFTRVVYRYGGVEYKRIRTLLRKLKGDLNAAEAGQDFTIKVRRP